MIEWLKPEEEKWTIRVNINQSGSGRISLNLDFFRHLNTKLVKIGYDNDKKTIVIKKAGPDDKNVFSIYHKASIASINSKALGEWLAVKKIELGQYLVKYNKEEDQYETVELLEKK
jgi:hypothetical protein